MKDKNQDNYTSLMLISQDIKRIKEDVTEIKTQLKEEFVTQTEFEPVKKITYSLVAVALLAVLGSLIQLVVK